MLALLKLQSFIIEVSENLIYLHIHFLNFHSLLAPPFKSSSGWGHGFYIFRDTYKKRITIMWLCGKKIVLKIPPRIYLLNFCHLLRLSYIESDRKSRLTLYLQNIKSFHVIFVFFAQFLKLILKTPTISNIFLLVTTCQK